MSKIINKIIKILIASDFFLNLGWGLMGPIFAIFILQNVAASSPLEAARVAGFAALFFWITKSILQIPIGRYLDRNHGEVDDFWFMVIGTFVMGFVPLGYLFSSQPWHIYALQVLHAVGAALAVPSYSAIFTRHIDKGKEALEWGSWSTFMGVGAGVSAGLGGVAVGFFGFLAVFIFVSAFTFLAASLLLVLKDQVLKSNKKVQRVPGEKYIIDP